MSDDDWIVTCPRCDGPLVPVVVGYPTLALFEAADRGEVVLGGCLGAPEPSACPRCRGRATTEEGRPRTVAEAYAREAPEG